MSKRPYNHVSVFSPSWLVKRIGEREYQQAFLRYKPTNLLDIGCGAGEKKTVIPKAVKYTGIDYPGTPHPTSDIDIFCSAYTIPIKNDSFDFVFCTGVLEHLEEPEAAIKEAYRLLQPSGYALYTIPLYWHLHEEPRDFYRYTKYGIKYLFEKAGFKIIELKPLSGFWITFGSELNYYLSLLCKIPVLTYLIQLIIMLNNFLFLFLEKLDRRLNPASERWTWMYLVVAMKEHTP